MRKSIFNNKINFKQNLCLFKIKKINVFLSTEIQPPNNNLMLLDKKYEKQPSYARFHADIHPITMAN